MWILFFSEPDRSPSSKTLTSCRNTGLWVNSRAAETRLIYFVSIQHGVAHEMTVVSPSRYTHTHTHRTYIQIFKHLKQYKNKIKSQLSMWASLPPCDHRIWQTSKSWSQWVSALWRGSRWLLARLCATSRVCRRQKWKKSRTLLVKCW